MDGASLHGDSPLADHPPFLHGLPSYPFNHASILLDQRDHRQRIPVPENTLDMIYWASLFPNGPRRC